MTDHVVSSDHMTTTAYHDLAFVRTQKSQDQSGSKKGYCELEMTLMEL